MLDLSPEEQILLTEEPAGDAPVPRWPPVVEGVVHAPHQPAALRERVCARGAAGDVGVRPHVPSVDELPGKWTDPSGRRAYSGATILPSRRRVRISVISSWTREMCTKPGNRSYRASTFGLL